MKFKLFMGERSQELYYGREGKIRAEKIRSEALKDKRAREQLYTESLNQQISRAQNLARISPAAAFMFSAARLAGTGTELSMRLRDAQRKFQEQNEVYQRYLRNEMFQKWTKERGQIMRDPDWFKREELPHFQMRQEPLGDRIEAAGLDMLLIVLFNVMFFMGAYAAFLRYDVS